MSLGATVGGATGTKYNYDAGFQQVYPQYATSDPNVQIPLLALMIVPPQATFKGFYDGFLNDNLMNFATALDSRTMRTRTRFTFTYGVYQCGQQL